MIYILYNPLANNGRGTEGLDGVIAAAGERHKDETPELVDVTREDEAAVLMAMGEGDEAILCGGDGTLHYLVNALDGQVPAAPLYLWRMGTGNDFLRDVLGKKQQQMVLLNPYLRDLPVAEVGGERRRFINNVCFGLDGQTCEQAEQEKARLGRPANYIMVALRLLLKDYQPAKASVTVDGVTKDYEQVWVASAFNGRYVGGGMKLAPGQDRKSDKLCCVVLHSLSRPRALANIAKVLWGGHVKMKECDVRFGHEIEITFDRPMGNNLDGEPTERVTAFKAAKMVPALAHSGQVC